MGKEEEGKGKEEEGKGKEEEGKRKGRGREEERVREGIREKALDFLARFIHGDTVIA